MTLINSSYNRLSRIIHNRLKLLPKRVQEAAKPVLLVDKKISYRAIFEETQDMVAFLETL
jgi:hypothetical protein